MPAMQLSLGFSSAPDMRGRNWKGTPSIYCHIGQPACVGVFDSASQASRNPLLLVVLLSALRLPCSWHCLLCHCFTPGSCSVCAHPDLGQHCMEAQLRHCQAQQGQQVKLSATHTISGVSDHCWRWSLLVCLGPSRGLCSWFVVDGKTL
jgi:hypothetical protein